MGRHDIGRCGRQGDPGTCEAFTSLDDELIQTYTPKLRGLGDREDVRWARGLSKHFRPVLFSIAQRAAERKHRQSRQDVLRMEVYLENTLAFAGAAE